ncbi:Cytosolic sulfotransferase [Actinidia chinensis var. chinensis]|uniref:Sulfotransferase n=1 Tax=Actinidia chinensis var. chinensis TaxID=1590841 RepID=A0A2R6RAC5_ACTCC|nr:Cytosolic sulfotransferase [Actinidia chinensis var. chinensis]
MNGLMNTLVMSHLGHNRLSTAFPTSQPQETDLILATYPKSGTTWLKALIFAIVTRTTYPLTENPLLFNSPHELVPFLEFGLYHNNPSPDLEGIPKPRIFSTHMPYTALPTSIFDSKCRVVYICRNPWDQLVSFWHFSTSAAKRWSTEYSISLDETLDMFCRGVISFGPFWDHVLGYWKASQGMPNKVLFLKYEDLKEDIMGQTKLLAQFLGFPFSVEEEGGGVVEEVSRLCSFENLKELEVNKTGKLSSGRDKSAFFRKAEVGDWSNYLTPPMAEKMKKLIQEKFEGSGLMFKMP